MQEQLIVSHPLTDIPDHTFQQISSGVCNPINFPAQFEYYLLLNLSLLNLSLLKNLNHLPLTEYTILIIEAAAKKETQRDCCQV
jgi:hypothetical protein